MRLEKASYKAVKYACLKFHYAKIFLMSLRVAKLLFTLFVLYPPAGAVGLGAGAGAALATGLSHVVSFVFVLWK